MDGRMTKAEAEDWGTPAPAQEDGRTRILAAAIEVFSASGFDGSSLRQIGDRAGVQHQLVVYHFKTKDALWRAAITTFFAQIGERETAWAKMRGVQGPAAALRQLVREFVHFTAEHPQYHRIATFEGRTDSERLRWLIEDYVRPFYEASTQLIVAAQAADEARAGHPGQLHYGMIGLVTTSFVFSREYGVMTGLDPFAKDQVEAVVQLAWDFLGIAERP
jgi:AcrR family transcriptional regulator